MLKKLAIVQGALKAPKNQFNSFGKYNYRSCEDILEAAKPLCLENGLLLTISDRVINVGDMNYVEATATIWDVEGGTKIEVSASARESVTKKGMDDSQITGSTSSYARKYALNGLFCIDDTKDTDSGVPNAPKKETPNKQNEPPKRKVTPSEIIAIGKQKGYEDEHLYKKIGVKKADDIKYLKADRKIELYDKLASLADKS